MNDGDKLDQFCTDLKSRVRLEVLRANADTVTDASKIALNVDITLTDTEMLKPGGLGAYAGTTCPSQSSQPMHIGNVEENPHYRGESFKGKRKETMTNDLQRQRDLQNNASFLCHKPGSRLCK